MSATTLQVFVLRCFPVVRTSVTFFSIILKLYFLLVRRKSTKRSRFVNIGNLFYSLREETINSSKVEAKSVDDKTRR